MSDAPRTPETEMTEQQLSELLQIRRDKLTALQEAGQDPFTITKYDVSIQSADIRANYDKLEGTTVSIAGRMMSRRIMGKASFMDLRDNSDHMQIYVRRDDIGVDEYMAFKKWDIGDILGVTGTVFRTQTGEISVHATSITLLAKSLLPLPEKFHGLKDTDTRYRQRYLDLIVNPDVKA
ncbi:MAG: lysine--tRNA ligase, partial [Clostridia bacterium]|nr:lysine--tRNA ligase [Clostridia bacterium]